MDALLPVVVGGLIAVVGGFVGSVVGAWLQSRRDHARWLREKRFDAYAAVVQYQVESMRIDAALKRADVAGGDPQRLAAELAALRADLKEHEKSLAVANVPLTLLGPRRVMKLATEYLAASVGGDEERMGRLFSALTAEMQRALRAHGD